MEKREYWGEAMKAAYDPTTIDPGVLELVEALRAAGWETGGSCEGGEGHPFDRPTVQIAASPDRLPDLVHWATHEPGCYTVSAHVAVQDMDVQEDASYLQIEAWPEDECEDPPEW